MIRTYLLIGAGIALLAVLAWSHTAAYRSGQRVGQASVIEKLNQENDNAGQDAEKWRGDLRRCNDAGGVFDFEFGTCQH